MMYHLGQTRLQNKPYPRENTKELNNEAIFGVNKMFVDEKQLQKQLLVNTDLCESEIQNECNYKVLQHVLKSDSDKELGTHKKHILKSVHKCLHDDYLEDNISKSSCVYDYIADDIDIINEPDDDDGDINVRRYVIITIPANDPDVLTGPDLLTGAGSSTSPNILTIQGLSTSGESTDSSALTGAGISTGPGVSTAAGVLIGIGIVIGVVIGLYAAQFL